MKLFLKNNLFEYSFKMVLFSNFQDSEQHLTPVSSSTQLVSRLLRLIGKHGNEPSDKLKELFATCERVSRLSIIYSNLHLKSASNTGHMTHIEAHNYCVEKSQIRFKRKRSSNIWERPNFFLSTQNVNFQKKMEMTMNFTNAKKQ